MSPPGGVKLQNPWFVPSSGRFVALVVKLAGWSVESVMGSPDQSS